MKPEIAGEAMLHVVLNAGKKSVAMDRSDSRWPKLFRDLITWADVVIVGAQPEAAKKRGLDFSSIAEINSNVVYCLITGYGLVGPWRNFPSHGLNTDMMAGLVPLEETDLGRAPRADYRSAGTTLAGVHAAIGILEALRRRGLGAPAQRVDSSVWESAMWWSWRDLSTLANLGERMPAYQNLGPRYAVYETSDGRSILVCPIERKFWRTFCDVVGLPSDRVDVGTWDQSGMDFGESYPDEHALIATAIRKRDFDDWVRAFSEADIPFSPVLDLSEALASEHAREARVMIETHVNGQVVQIPRIPIRLETLRTEARADYSVSPPPALGEHTQLLVELLSEPNGSRQARTP
jgi:crotonobetainyl-CoA:carnitine CoA-transferase CaiB-like acyl-CoA transferase